MARVPEFSLYRLLRFQRTPFFRPRRSGRIGVRPLRTPTRMPNRAHLPPLRNFRRHELLQRNEVKAELRRRMHEPPEQGQWLQAVVRGHLRYYGVPMNSPALTLFRLRVGRLWHRALSRRSQNGRVLWERMQHLITRWLPLAKVCHPYPLRRMGVIP
jgi:hypothetical protein